MTIDCFYDTGQDLNAQKFAKNWQATNDWIANGDEEHTGLYSGQDRRVLW